MYSKSNGFFKFTFGKKTDQKPMAESERLLREKGMKSDQQHIFDYVGGKKDVSIIQHRPCDYVEDNKISPTEPVLR